MAEPSSSSALAEETQKLYLDDVTQEQVTKTELKRRQKHRLQEAKKQEKKAAAPPPKKKETETETNMEELNPNQFYERRVATMAADKSSGKNSYPHKFHRDTTAGDFLELYKDLEAGQQIPEKTVSLAGRMLERRQLGGKLYFYVVRSRGVKIQIVCQAQLWKGKDFAAQNMELQRGDVIGFVGHPGRTKPSKGGAGEISIFATDLQRLTPCLRMLPSSHFGLEDKEQRFRERYLDFVINDASRQNMKIRGEAIQYIRQFFLDRGFLEVETPMMNNIAGGATARPFVTHHNELDLDMFMRVAPELFLKMLIVGELEAVFEIGKNFRNEGVDLTHNPEFTSCEFYQAYADYNDLMTLTEELVFGLVKQVTGGTKTTYHTREGKEYNVDWSTPWKRIEMLPELEKVFGEKFPTGKDLDSDMTTNFLLRMLEKTGTHCEEPKTNARMLDKLVGEYLESRCINPTFILNHPKFMSPLAKDHRDIPGLCERFELFVCTKELANAYTELNDPAEQRERFTEQARQKEAGDDEAQAIDENFCRALEYGLPPTAGWGMGIDRLIMFLTDNYNIKEVLAFPFMKDEINVVKPVVSNSQQLLSTASIEEVRARLKELEAASTAKT